MVQALGCPDGGSGPRTRSDCCALEGHHSLLRLYDLCLKAGEGDQMASSLYLLARGTRDHLRMVTDQFETHL